MIKMSKPIEYIEENKTEDDSLIPDEYRESLDSFLKTIKNLNDSGFLTLVNAMAANYKFIMGDSEHASSIISDGWL